MLLKTKSYWFIILILVLALGCSQPGVKDGQKELKITCETFKLKNGLDVIFHKDKSDPIAAVAIQFHVGSNREVKGRTGFAHLFEHMMFQESQHIGQDQFFKKIQSAGGMLNGGTGRDGTVYFEVVPKNALEMVLWMEADRMGFLGSTVTQEAFANQQGVVKNEKRQVVDNRPYGHTRHILGKLLYPENHPYNWDVIGSMEDLTNATLKDVHEFHQKWYRPNNATLVIAGDFDKEQTKKWVEKYFGEIKSGGKIEDPKPTPIKLEKTKMAYHEDNFAKSPELRMVFPTVELYHSDSYALEFLAELLTGSKKAPLYKTIVEEKKLAPSVRGYQYSSEIAGEFSFTIRTFPAVKLNEVKSAIFESLKKFETESFTEKDVERIKSKIETGFYNRLSSILYKSFQLARYNEYAGSPDFISTHLKHLLAVSKEDINRVYNTYIKDKHYVLTSFVPKGKVDQIVDNSEKFPIDVEPVVAKATKEGTEFKVEKIESSFDRTQEPAKGPEPTVTLPEVWKSELGNGIKIYGIEHKELPLIQFSITLKGGLWLDNITKAGVANLVSRLMVQGTKTKTPVELEEAIDELGARITVRTGQESITMQVNCLAGKFDNVYTLAEEILLQPRWDEKEFDREKKQVIERIHRNRGNPNALSINTFNKLVFGDKHVQGYPVSGTAETVEKISIADLKEYYDKYISPSVAHISIVGDVSQERAVNTFKQLEEKWVAKEVPFPEYNLLPNLEKSTVYFVDVPGARQSVIRIGNLFTTYNNPDFYPAHVMNYKLGGSFNGIVNMILREEKGYTYGARTRFSGALNPGTFAAFSSVQSKVTLESVQIFKDSMTKYREGISEEDLQFTKDALLKSNALNFETLRALLGILDNIATYNLPFDYLKKHEEIVRKMTLKQHQELAGKFINPDKMIYLIVGDASSQLTPLEKLGFGKPVLIK